MPTLGATEILIIVGVVVLLFGATKLPKLARSLGESARIFKSETKGLRDDDEETGASGGAEDGQDDTPTVKQLPNSERQEPRTVSTSRDYKAS